MTKSAETNAKSKCYIFTSIKQDSHWVFFLLKLIVIHTSVETDRTETHTPCLLIGQKLKQPTKISLTALNNHDVVRFS